MKVNYSEIRKKLLFFTPIIGLLFLIHLIGVYIYEGGKSLGVQGGSINIGIVGEAPPIPNPLNYNEDTYHDLILRFLYRPLISYNPLEGSYQGNIGRCDLSNLSKIRCEINKDQYWSDGTSIQVEDIVATYQSFRSNPPSEKMGMFLKNVSFVTQGENLIEINSKEKNSLILDLLTYPIVRSDMIERIRTDRMSATGYITSGAYTFSERGKNDEYGYDRVTIIRNEKNGGEGWLNKYHFLFFPDLASLQRSAENLSIIIPPVKNEKLIFGPRFDEYTYSMYEYIGLFLNTDELSTDIRRQLYGKIVESFSGKIDPSEIPVKNIFSLDTPIEGLKLEKNLSDVMKTLGYRKVDDRLAELSAETGMLTGSSVEYGNTRYFSLPSRKKVYFTEVAGGSILLSGSVPAGTTSVYINGYELREYRTGSDRFNYRVSLENTTLTQGKNIYSLEFGKSDGTRDVVDTLTIYYSTDSGELERMKKEVENEYIALLNTPEKVSERKALSEKQKEKLITLDRRYYYGENGEPFQVKIAYMDDPKTLETYAGYLAGALESLSIQSTLIPLTTKDLETMLKEGKKDYDFIIIGFEANNRLSRIGQIFLSTEAKNGINFAKIESKKLDTLFAELRVAPLQEETEKIQKEILEYMQSEGFFLTLSSPLHSLYIDKNLKGIRKIALFQDISTLHSVIATASIKDAYMITTEGKSFSGFFSWIYRTALRIPNQPAQ